MRRKKNEKKEAIPSVPEPTDKLFHEIPYMSLAAFVQATDGMDPNAESRVGSGGTLLTWAAVRILRNLCVAPPPHPCFASLLAVLHVGVPPRGHRRGTAVARR